METVQQVNPETEMSAKEKIQAWMLKHRVTIESDFVPCSKSRNAKSKESSFNSGQKWSPTLNWKVRVVKNWPDSGPYTILETDYSAGSGHCLTYKNPGKGLTVWHYMTQEAIAWECENGFAAWHIPSTDSFIGRRKQPILPDPCDVLSSLAMDSSVLDAGTFEEWADNFGYDKDSRKAEAIYKECLAIALKLRNGLGEAVMTELREACQDY